jgi:hypothetical protein
MTMLGKRAVAGAVRAERLAGTPDANTAPEFSPPRDQPVGSFLFEQILHGKGALATDIYTLSRRKIRPAHPACPGRRRC